MTFQDIFQSSFLDNSLSISILDMVIALVLSFAVGLFVFWIYKKVYSGVMYSASFGISLIAMTMITTLVIMAVTSNIVLSLGMVGALSIVRFRAAIKDPMDIVFLFWSIAAGIVLAAGLIPLAVLGSVFIGIILRIFSGYRSVDQPYILMFHCDDQSTEDRIKEMLKANTKKMVLKSKSVKPGSIELNYEVRLKQDDTTFINILSAEEGVHDLVLVSYNGDYMG